MKDYFFYLLILFAISSNAQDTPDIIVERFFQRLENEGGKSSLEYLFSTNKWYSQSQDQVNTVIERFESTVPLLGKYTDYNLLSKSEVQNLEFRTYLVRYDRQPLRFNFLFYNPNNEWRIQNFSFDDSIDDDLEKMAKQIE